MLTLSRWKIVLVTLSVIFGILFTLPNLLPQKTLDSFPGWLPKQKLNLGLDLQGGSYLMYEVDTVALRQERLKNLVEDVRTVLRGEQIAFGELAEVNGTVRLRIADASKVDEAASLLRRSVGSPFAGSVSGRDVSRRQARRPAPGNRLSSPRRPRTTRRWRSIKASRPSAAVSTAWAPRNRTSRAKRRPNRHPGGGRERSGTSEGSGRQDRQADLPDGRRHRYAGRHGRRPHTARFGAAAQR